VRGDICSFVLTKDCAFVADQTAVCGTDDKTYRNSYVFFLTQLQCPAILSFFCSVYFLYFLFYYFPCFTVSTFLSSFFLSFCPYSKFHTFFELLQIYFVYLTTYIRIQFTLFVFLFSFPRSRFTSCRLCFTLGIVPVICFPYVRIVIVFYLVPYILCVCIISSSTFISFISLLNFFPFSFYALFL